MFKNFFEARDELDRAILADEITGLPSAALAILRLLLSHAFYDFDKNPDRYGYVNSKVWGERTIAKLTSSTEKTVRGHLQALEDARLIHVRIRPNWNGGRQTSEITITWPVFHDEDEAEPVEVTASEAVAEPVVLSTEPVVLSTEPVESTASFLSKNVRIANKEQPPSGEDRAKETTRVLDGDLAEVPTWDGDIDRLIIPARFEPGIQEYYVSADGSCRPVRGKPRVGEVRAKLNFDEISYDRLIRQGHTRALARAI